MSYTKNADGTFSYEHNPTKENLAMHEAGHGIVGLALGFCIEMIDIDPGIGGGVTPCKDENGLEELTGSPQENIDEVSDWAFRLGTIKAAGVAAEAFWKNHFQIEIFPIWQQNSDAMEMRRVHNVLTGALSGYRMLEPTISSQFEEFDVFEIACIRRAEELVKIHWAAVQTLAKTLESNLKIDAQELQSMKLV